MIVLQYNTRIFMSALSTRSSMVSLRPIFHFSDEHLGALFSAHRWLFRNPKAPANALSPGAHPYGNRFLFFFCDGDIFADNLKKLFAFSWGGFSSQHISETGFGQLLEFPRGKTFPILD